MKSLDNGSHAFPAAGARGSISIELAMGTAIEARRVELRKTLEELAGSAGIPPSTLAEYEAGVRRVSGEHVLAIACALEVTVSHLFSIHPGARH